MNANTVATKKDLILVQNLLYRWKRGENDIIFGDDMTSFVHIDYKCLNSC